MTLKDKTILVTGSNGFIGKNLLQKLSEIGCENVLLYNRGHSLSDLSKSIECCDIIYHLAGANRPINEDDFDSINFGLTKTLCDYLANLPPERRKKIHLVYISSAHYNLPTKYGLSKKRAESAIETLKECGVNFTIFRLPGVFGKWAKPNYNSVVATFCYNIANSKPIEVLEPDKVIDLVYSDDVIDSLITTAVTPNMENNFADINDVYHMKIGELANKIRRYSNIRNTLEVSQVGEGFERALYSTYLSYITPTQFKYPIPIHSDTRGMFSEMLKTEKSDLTMA